MILLHVPARRVGTWAALFWIGLAALAPAADDMAAADGPDGPDGDAEIVEVNPFGVVDRPAAEPPAAVAPAAPVPVVVRHPPVRRMPVARTYRSLPANPPRTEAARAALQAALERDVGTRWEFDERSLADVAAALAADLGVPVLLDRAALEADDIDPDLEVSFRSHGSSAGAALELMLRPLGLSWSIADGAIVITTHDAVCGTMIVRVYPLPFGSGRRGAEGVARLAETVLATIATETWDVHGGPASLQPLEEAGEPLLVVSQSRAAHEEIEALFATLHRRGLAEFEPPAGAGPPAPCVRVHRVADARIRADLAAQLVGLCNASLGEGGDPRAGVEQVGECLAVRSVSPEFHALAEQLVDAVAGIGEPPEAAAARPVAGGGPF